MLVTGDSSDNDRIEELIENHNELLDKILKAILAKKDATPVINVEQPAIVFPEQKAAIVNVPEQKQAIINIPEPQPRKPYAIRCKIVRGTYGEIDYIDLFPILKD